MDAKWGNQVGIILTINIRCLDEAVMTRVLSFLRQVYQIINSLTSPIKYPVIHGKEKGTLRPFYQEIRYS